MLRRDGFASLAPRERADLARVRVGLGLAHPNPNPRANPDPNPNPNPHPHPNPDPTSRRAAGSPAQLTTRPLAFNGSHLFLNLVLRPAGWLRVEVLPAHGDGAAPLCGLGRARSRASARPAGLDARRPARVARRRATRPLAGATVSKRVEWCRSGCRSSVIGTGAPACPPTGRGLGHPRPAQAPPAQARYLARTRVDLPTVVTYPGALPLQHRARRALRLLGGRVRRRQEPRLPRRRRLGVS